MVSPPEFAPIQQLANALRALPEPIRSRLVPPLRSENPILQGEGLNIWVPQNHLARYPDDTVWAPTPQILTHNHWTWGASFQHTAPATTPPAELALLIADTLRPRTSPGARS